jgi:hydrogenase maturation factor
MSAGAEAPVLVAEVVSVEDGPEGRTGVVDVRGAQVRIALDLVPRARVGDAVLVHAGVAIATWREERPWEEEEAPCAWPCRDA